MRVQVIERAIRLLTTLPATLVHSLDFFVSATGALVLLRTRNRNKGIDLLELVRHAAKDSADRLRATTLPELPAGTYLSWPASGGDIWRCVGDTGGG